MNRKNRKMVEDPVMSDKTLLVSVEDLIHVAFGTKTINKVNFKLLQTILHILARQLHLLEQDLEIKIDEFTAEPVSKYGDGYNDESRTYSSSSSEVKEDEAKRERRKHQEEKAKQGEKVERKGRRGKGEKEDGKTSSKDREGKGRSKDRDDKDKTSRDRDAKDKSSRDTHKSSGRKKGEDDGDEGGRERKRGRERGEERGGERGGKRGEEQGGEQDGERGGEQSKVQGGERGADGRRGRGGEREDNTRRQDRGGLGRDLGRQTSGASNTATGVRPARVGSIEVVTASQFALLGKAVKQLEQITGPLPQPVLPDNETLRQDLVQGRASLQDTMQAVQLNARVQAAEQGLYRMAQLLTQLAQSGTLPPEFADRVGAMEEYLQAAIAAGFIAADLGGPGGPDSHSGKLGRPSAGTRSAQLGKGRGGKSGKFSTASRVDAQKSTASATAPVEATEAAPLRKSGVTHTEMGEMLQRMKTALTKEINKLTSQSNFSADMASNISKSLAEKMDIALHVDERINTLWQQSEDYAEQLRGFDTGTTIQVQTFQEQLAMMRDELSGHLALLEAANNNTETTSLVELKERHEDLVISMDETVQQHRTLTSVQQEFSDELMNMLQCVEVLREQQADRDEVLDGLNDKANFSRLAGLLYEKDFAHARLEIEQRISKCYEMFSRQNAKWQEALIELKVIIDSKAELNTMMALKDATNAELESIQELLHKLEVMLGEPKAAILMRKLAKDASCGACMTPALMEPEDATHGKPLPLPALLPALGVELQPCLKEVKLMPSDIRDHACHRWAGGSHTLMVGNIVQEQAQDIQLQIIPTKKYDGYGSDGKLYLMEDDMQPCAQCNQLSTDEPDGTSPRLPTPDGAGDQASAPPAK